MAENIDREPGQISLEVVSGFVFIILVFGLTLGSVRAWFLWQDVAYNNQRITELRRDLEEEEMRREDERLELQRRTLEAQEELLRTVRGF